MIFHIQDGYIDSKRNDDEICGIGSKAFYWVRKMRLHEAIEPRAIFVYTSQIISYIFQEVEKILHKSTFRASMTIYV